MQKLVIPTEDQLPLDCSLFKAQEEDLQKVLIINSATGVKQQMYFAFAEYAAKQGITVITYDYRGIGLSKPKQLKHFKANMRDWGNLDFKAITAYALRAYPSYQLFLLGHSVGALILGMNPYSIHFEKVLFVATQNAYVGHLNLKTKLSAYLGFGIAQPLSTALFGYFPAHYFGLGESLPSGVAYDWRSLILNSKSTNYLLENSTNNLSQTLEQPCFVLYAEDDDWLTEYGVKSLLTNTYPHLKASYRILKRKESEVGEIGHVNYFRKYNTQLWSILLSQIL